MISKYKAVWRRLLISEYDFEYGMKQTGEHRRTWRKISQCSSVYHQFHKAYAIEI